MRYVEEHNKLLKVKLFKQGSNQWRLLPMEKRDGSKIRRGEITFRGSDEKLKLLLRRLKAKDVTTDPPSSKNKSYQQMIDTAKDKSDPYIWVWLTLWNNYREDNKITIAEKQENEYLEVSRLLDIIYQNEIKSEDWVDNQIKFLDDFESGGEITKLNTKIKEYEDILKKEGIQEMKEIKEAKKFTLIKTNYPQEMISDVIEDLESMCPDSNFYKGEERGTIKVYYTDKDDLTIIRDYLFRNKKEGIQEMKEIKEQETISFYSITLDDLIEEAGGLRGLRAKVKDSDEAYEYLMRTQDSLIKKLSKEIEEIEEVDPTDVMDWANNNFESPSYIRKLLRKNPSFIKTIKKYYDEWEKSNFQPKVGYKFGKEYADAYYKEFKEVPFDPAQSAIYVLEDYGNGKLKEGIYKDKFYGTEVDIFLQRNINRMDPETLIGILMDEYGFKEYDTAEEVVIDYKRSKGFREKEAFITITKPIKIGNVILEKGDKIKILKESKDAKS